MSITTTSLTRAAGISAVVAGLLFIGVQVNHPALSLDFVSSTEFAVRQIHDAGEHEAGLWVLEGNAGARAFYRRHGWTETGQKRPCRYRPNPDELRMVKQVRRPPRRAA